MGILSIYILEMCCTKMSIGSRPFQWASKNTFGWFVDRLLILSIEHPTFARLEPFLEKLHVA